MAGMKYRKKPIIIDAIQWNGGQWQCLVDFCGHKWRRVDAVDKDCNDPELVDLWNTAEKQWLHLPVGHWIIRGISGELYPCAPDIFAATYEPVQDQ